MSIGKTTDLNLVNTAQIVDGSVTSAKIGSGSINSTHIGANAVVLGNISAGAVDSSALAANSVVAAKIDAGAVGSAALAANAVVAAKIAAAAVGVVAISSGTSTSGTLLTADGAGGVSFSAAPAGGGMVLISSATCSVDTASLGFTNIPQTYTRLHLIGQFYVTSAGEYQIGINPSTVTSTIGGTTGFASKIYYISKTSENGTTTYATGLNNMEGTAGSVFYCTLPNMTNRWANVKVDIHNPRALAPISTVGFMAQHNAGRFGLGHSWGTAESATGPIRTLWVSGMFNKAIFNLYGS
jgi:hypothetical protein